MKMCLEDQRLGANPRIVTAENAAA